MLPDNELTAGSGFRTRIRHTPNLRWWTEPSAWRICDLWKIQCARRWTYSPILDLHRRPQMSHGKSDMLWFVTACLSIRFALSDKTQLFVRLRWWLNECVVHADVESMLMPSLLCDQVRISVVRTLPSADIDDMPVIVRFLLQTVTPVDAYQVWISYILYTCIYYILSVPHCRNWREWNYTGVDGTTPSLLILDLSTPPSNPISKLTCSVLQAFLAPSNTIHAILIHI